MIKDMVVARGVNALADWIINNGFPLGICLSLLTLCLIFFLVLQKR